MTVAAQFEIEYLQYLDADGKLAGKLPPAVKDAKALLPLFKQMLYVRTFDTKSIALQRTGKLGTYAACLGHEATHVGIGASMQPEDVFAPSYREYGAQFMRGVQPREVLMYWGGDERGNDFAGPEERLPVVRADRHPVPDGGRRGAGVQAAQAGPRSRCRAAATAVRRRPISTPRSIPPAPTSCRWCCA